MSEKFVSTSPSTTNGPTVNTSSLAAKKEISLKDQLTPIVTGLLRMDKLSSALEEYQQVLIAEVKSLSNKVCLIST